MIEKRTHVMINEELCGKVMKISKERSTVELVTTKDMTVDEHNLIHGGFIFSVADHAAMVAINQPNVVLGAANVKFLHPVKAGDRIIADARVVKVDGKKKVVTVDVMRGTEKVFSGEFTCFVPDKHVLE
ncbi:MAG TPA: hotdog domain-containing protein [Candidatus Lokiarchaeia archaeon]|nr:hotdog domain-containing protein [Candidatus Lokiarchaeia archaeon]